MIEEQAPAEPRTQADHAHSLVKALRGVPSLAACDEQTLLWIVGDSLNLVWPGGGRVFEVGTPATGLFLVLSGGVRVLDEDGSEVAMLGRGEYFGELSLLLGTAHQHTVETVEDTELMIVPKERFDSLLRDNLALAADIMRKAEQRMAMNKGESPTD
jgi:CRP-like cAMP-binding protein